LSKDQAALLQLNDPAHPDHALYKEALRGVQALDAQAGRTSDQQSERLAAALTVAARKAGMGHIDQVVAGNNASQVFAVEGALNSPFKEIAGVPTMAAMNTSMAQSTQAWNEAAQQAQQRTQEQNQQSNMRPQPTHSAPLMAA
jgi:putative chitinase